MHRVLNELVDAVDTLEGHVLPFGYGLWLVRSQRVAKWDAVGTFRYVGSHRDARHCSVCASCEAHPTNRFTKCRSSVPNNVALLPCLKHRYTVTNVVAHEGFRRVVPHNSRAKEKAAREER